ncbi:hypothetical protein QA584_25900 [Anaerocolumna sp. AGMB13025]|nr:hypothetical protein [Anaerocolumna sp. AGMB13025]WFR57006.1 hypothetical protein QA584_25900 [Anaerocolumna sp. AGMB13025]
MAKIRYYLALIVIVLAISNVTVSFNQSNQSIDIHSLGNSIVWGIETS